MQISHGFVALLQALPIFLDKLLSPLLSVVLSVTAVLLVGKLASLRVVDQQCVAQSSTWPPSIQGKMMPVCTVL